MKSRLIHDHRIVAIDTYRRGLEHDAPPSALEEFAPHFGTDTLVSAREQEVEQRLALVLGDVVAIPLRKRK